MNVAINQVLRDKYPGNEKRTVRITEVLPNGVNAVIVTDVKGNRPTAARHTTLMFKTLRAGYTPVES